MNFLSGKDEFLSGQDDFFQTGNQPISVRHLSQPYNNSYYCRFQVTFQRLRAVPKFVANLPIARFSKDDATSNTM